MKDAGQPLPERPSHRTLEAAAESLATMQIKTIHCTDVLLEAGAFDQRISVLVEHVDTIIAYLAEAMSRQTSTKAAPVAKERIQDLGCILRDALYRMETLHVPDTLLHNDLNADNVLYDGYRCVFTDWSEAAIGHPFLLFDRLCRLQMDCSLSLRRVYQREWSEGLDEQTIEDAFTLMPLLAIFAYLYGRGEWVYSEEQKAPRFESCARALARHMDREARNPLLLDALRR
jgi:Phosphotransferase enzyme family